MASRWIKNIMRIIWFSKPIKYAKWIGVQLGADCKIINHPNWGSEPYLISIGDHTEISCGVTFLIHDGATWISRRDEKYKNQEIIKYGCIQIGDDCFIGCNSTILPRVSIGNKAIVAAGSVVTKSIPAGETWGVPAKRIISSEEYLQKCIRSNCVDLSQYKENKRVALKAAFYEELHK